MREKKKFWKRIAALVSSLAVMAVSVPSSQVVNSFAEENDTSVTVDTTDSAENDTSVTVDTTDSAENDIQPDVSSEETETNEQSDSVTIRGTVKDQNGNAVSDTNFTFFVNDIEYQNINTDANGMYELIGIPVSPSYVIKINSEKSAEKVFDAIYSSETEINNIDLQIDMYCYINFNYGDYKFYTPDENGEDFEIDKNHLVPVEYGESYLFKIDTSENLEGKVSAVKSTGEEIILHKKADNDKYFVIEQITDDLSISIDTEAPNFSVSVDDQNWTNKKSINVEGIENGDSVYCYYTTDSKTLSSSYVKNEGENITNIINDKKYDVTENGNYFFCVEDYKGNISDKPKLLTIRKIDSVKPNVSVESVVIINGQAEITGTASDSLSGLKKVFLSTDENKTADISDKGRYVFKEVSESGLNNLSVIAVDNAGNKSEPVPLSDSNVFTMTVKYDTSDKWTTGNSIEVKTNQECSIACNAEATNDSNVFLAKENGNYTITAKDSSGNVLASANISINYIDTDNPVIKDLKKDPNRTWTNQSIIISGKAEDMSGISKIQYAKVSVNESLDEITEFSEEGVNLNKDGTFTIRIPDNEFNGVCCIRAFDNCGKISKKYTIDIKIDTTAPQNVKMNYMKEENTDFIKQIINVLSNNTLYRDKILISVEATDDRENKDSGIAMYQYQLVNKGSDLSEDDSSWNVFKNSSSSVEIEILATDYPEGFEGKVYVRVVDNAGNVTQAVTDTETGKESIVILDNKKADKPDIDTNGYAAGSVDNPNWTKDSVTITLSGGNVKSGVDHYEYSIDYTDPSIDDTYLKNSVSDWTEIPETNSITISEDTNATYYFRAVSNTKVAGQEASVYVTIQKTNPENAEVTIPDINGKNGWYVKDFPSVTIKKAVAKEYAAPIKTFYSIWNEQDGETEPADGRELSENNFPEIKKDGIYQLRVWTVDAAGNQCVDKNELSTNDSHVLKVDTTVPVKQELYIVDNSESESKKDISVQEENSIIYPHIYKDAIEIRTSFDFDISGKELLQYQFVNSYAVGNGPWEDYNEDTGIIVKPNKKFILAVKATDKAGNDTISFSDGIIVDNEAPVGESLAPEITIIPDLPNGNGFHNSDVGVMISVQDPPYYGETYDPNGIYSGLESVVYRVITDGMTTQEETLFSAEKNPSDADLQSSFSANITVSSALNNSNNIFVEVVAVDRAGNERVSRTPEGAIKIDTTAPTIRISYDNNSPDSTNVKYFKDARTATIEVTERNFNPDDVRLSLTNTDGVIPSISGWTTYSGTGNMDDTVHSATLTYSADGDYTFDIAYTDMADNPCREISYVSGTAAPQEFTIDRTAPVINVSYDNNSVKNGKYFSKARVATVVIQEHNFDSSRVKITATASRNGKSISIPSSDISWTGSGDNHTAVINYKEDGDYTFDIEFTDMAGNESDSANYGSSASGKDFVVDTTIEKPEVTLNGEDGNGKAFKGDLKLAVSFGDINFDSYDIKLERVVKGEKPEDVTEQFINNLKVNGSSYEGTFDTFKKVQENDGIYTLIVTLTDKAGNSETTEVKFTVNRFGSVYEYSEYLVSLIADGGQYVKSLEDDLVITEYNADRLVEDSLSIVITKDGKPLENAECEVTPVINDKVSTGESGWYQYDYIISKDNFASDGVYKMVVSSEDEAGNTPENTNYDDKSVLFRVDSTAPELTSVTGLEKSIYNGQKLTVGYDVYDTIGLKSVKVYIDGNEVDQIADFNEDANNYNGSFDINESEKAQSVRLVVEDKAGNITDTDKEEFTSAYDFEKLVTVSTNIFVRWYANKPLFWSSIGGIGAVGIGAGLLIFIGKKKKKTA